MTKTQTCPNTESKLLGAALTDSDAAYRMVEVLGEKGPGMFYERDHRFVAEAVWGLVSNGKPVDLVTVSDQMDDDGTLSKVGENGNAGRMWVTNLSVRGGLAMHVEAYAERVQKFAMLRGISNLARKSYYEAHQNGADPVGLLDDIQERSMDLGEKGASSAQEADLSETTMEVVKDILKTTDLRRKGKNPATGIPSGYPKLDELTGGWQDSDLIIIAARPSVGKTAFSLCCALNAMTSDRPTGVGFFSFEMGASQLVQRLIGMDAEVQMKRASQGYGSDRDLKKIATSASKVKQLPFYVYDGDLSMVEIRAKVRYLVRKKGVGLIVIDYLQLMSGSGDAQTREQEIAKISRQLKLLAIEMDVPIIALSQLNRGVEHRGSGARPRLSDLRESGAIEQDADIVTFIHRVERIEGMEIHDELQMDPTGIADIILSKQRNGPTGTVYLNFEDRYSKFLHWGYDDAAFGLEQEGIEAQPSAKGLPEWANRMIQGATFEVLSAEKKPKEKPSEENSKKEKIGGAPNVKLMAPEDEAQENDEPSYPIKKMKTRRESIEQMTGGIQNEGPVSDDFSEEDYSEEGGMKEDDSLPF